MTAAKVVLALLVGWITGGLAVAALFGWWLHSAGGDDPEKCTTCGYWFGANELEFGVCPECAGPPVDDPEWARLVDALIADEDDVA